MIWVGVAFEAGLVGVAVALGWLFGRPAFEDLRLDWGDAGVGAAAAIPLLFLMMWLWGRPWAPIARIRRELEDTLLPLFSGAPLLALVLVSAAAGVGEETLFRGVIQPAAAAWFGLPAGVLAASALFGLAHLVTRAYALLAGLIGLYLGLLLLATENLLAPVVAHALYDLVALRFLLRLRRPRV
ncbi:MAG: type II CAAX prenyl endopeptidase Rce1 family protein [Gemmatimonadales bacterium]